MVRREIVIFQRKYKMMIKKRRKPRCKPQPKQIRGWENKREKQGKK
jgi:hypothetical protein